MIGSTTALLLTAFLLSLVVYESVWKLAGVLFDAPEVRPFAGFFAAAATFEILVSALVV
jgi:hypothetical protein